MTDHPSRLVAIGPVWLPRWFVVWGCWAIGAAVVCLLFVDRPVEMLMRYQRPRELYFAADALTKLASSGPYFLGLPVDILDHFFCDAPAYLVFDHIVDILAGLFFCHGLLLLPSIGPEQLLNHKLSSQI